MILTGLFLYNLLCALAPCEPQLDAPEVRVKKSPATTASTTSILSTDGPTAPVPDRDEMRDSPMVVTTVGGLEGYTMFSTEGREIFAFEGIPYAEPPVGHRRLRAPVPKKPWLGIRKARQVGPECLQLNPAQLMRMTGDEDCLYLNVYTLQAVDYTKERKTVPVIFYIHGGAYYFGSGGEYGPNYLLNHDVVLVTINYRLGVLGFLSTGDSSGPGNYGLKDQALALKWVSENIKFFGGDPKRITVMGHSSSGAGAHLHSMSPLSRNLFRSGISLSGSAFTHWAVKSPEEAQRLSDKLAGITGCSTAKPSKLMDCFREKNPVSLVSAQFRLLDWVPFPMVLFAPVVEPPSEEAFLTTTPEEYYVKINTTRHETAKPWIFGMTAEEGYVGTLFLRLLMGEWTLRYQWTDYAPAFLDFQHTAKDPKELANRLANLYFGDYTSRTVPSSHIAQLFADRHFLHGIYKAVTKHSLVAPTYAYYFQYKGKYNPANRWTLFRKQDWGAGHTEDLYYYFNSTAYYPGFKRADKEYQLSHVMTTLVANFAETGIPLMSTDRGSLVRIWDKVDPNNQRFLRFDREIKMIPRPMTDRYELWESFSNDTKADLHIQ